MIESDIRMLVALVIMRFGSDADRVAAVRADAFAAKGDFTGAEIWSRIRDGIRSRVTAEPFDIGLIPKSAFIRA